MRAKKSDDRADGRPDHPDQGHLASDHSVVLPRPLAVGTYPVTRREYGQFVQETGRRGGGCYGWNGITWTEAADRDWRRPGFTQTQRDPVVCVNYSDAESYAEWLNSKVAATIRRPGIKVHGPYRLPTWDEAEYAAAAGTTTTFYWGEIPSRSAANYGKDDCFPCGPDRGDRDRWLFTSPVGAFPPNQFGLFDTAGNVFEWLDDCYPKVPAPSSCLYGPARGGSWLTSFEYLRTDEFMLLERANRNTNTGFRVVRDSTEQE